MANPSDGMLREKIHYLEKTLDELFTAFDVQKYADNGDGDLLTIDQRKQIALYRAAHLRWTTSELIACADATTKAGVGSQLDKVPLPDKIATIHKQGQKHAEDFEKLSKMYVETNDRLEYQFGLNMDLADLLDNAYVPKMVDVSKFAETPFADENWKPGDYKWSTSVLDRVKYLITANGIHGDGPTRLKLEKITSEYEALYQQHKQMEKDFERLHDML